MPTPPPASTTRLPFGHASKALWPLDPDLLYLNHGTVGVTPNAVIVAQRQITDEIEREPARFLLRELAPHQRGSRVGPPRLRVAAEAVAAFVHARPDDLVFVDNITVGANAVLRSFAFEPGDDVLVTDLGYGAVTYSAQYATSLRGASVRTVEMPFPVSSEDAIVDAWVNAIGPRTRLAIVDHITSASALVMPVHRIVAALKSRGVAVFVDGAHAPGQMDLDVPSIGADWYSANLHKWACAPRSSAFLWAAPERQATLKPTVTSWGFGQGFVGEFDHAGTRDPSPFLAAPAGIAFLKELGLEAMWTYQRDLAWRTGEILTSRWGTRIETPRSMIGAMITVPLPARAATSDEAVQALRDALLYEDRIELQMHWWRGMAWARVCTQIYVEPSDIERLADAVVRRIGA
ncbi:MAG: aminotransferase class V-fold PLP-dependent enzyme [Acidobacteria bacterium]|nr:aminotransferase class V-fold PLP-dependent enzyme [Acidobacteriota bacterium]